MKMGPVCCLVLLSCISIVLLNAEADFSEEGEWVWDEGIWHLEELRLAPMGDDEGIAVFDFGDTDETISGMAFTVGASDLDIVFDGSIVFSLLFDEYGLSVYWLLDGAWQVRDWPMFLPDEPVTLFFDLAGWELQLSGRTWHLPDMGLNGGTAMRSVELANRDSGELLLKDFFLVPTSSVKGSEDEFESGPGEGEEPPTEEEKETDLLQWAMHPYYGRILISLPPPHPYIVMDEERRVVGLPEDENARVHRRPHMVPDRVLQKWIEAAKAGEGGWEIASGQND